MRSGYLVMVDAFVALLHETVIVTAVLCLPILILAAVVGTVVAVMQAVTQVQEQTLSVLPKLAIIGLALVLGANAGFAMLAGLFHEALQATPAIIMSAIS